MHGGDSRGSTSLKHLRLYRDKARREHRRSQHQHVSRRYRTTTASAGNQEDPGERKSRAAPRPWPRATVAEGRRHQRHEDRDGTKDDRRVTHACPLDPGVLEHDHAAESDRPGDHHARVQRLAQRAASNHPQQRGARGKPGDGQPRGIKPSHGEF